MGAIDGYQYIKVPLNFSKQYFKIVVYSVEVVISIQTELGSWEKGWLSKYFLIGLLNMSCVSENFLHLIFISST